jgi:hypothetical protein
VELDPDNFRLTPEQMATWPEKKAALAKSPRRQKGDFLKGPIPLEWLASAARLPGKALAVGVAVWFESGRKKRRTVALTGPVLQRFGVSRFATYRALQILATAGLVSVERRTGKNPTVTLLDLSNLDKPADSDT